MPKATPPFKQMAQRIEAEREQAKKQYKRDMMLQLVRNEALTEIIMQLLEGNELHDVIGDLADKLTEEAFK